MELRDYIPLLALLISLISLFISLRSAGFTKRTKLAELRALMLSKISEALMTSGRAQLLSSEISRLAQARNDTEILEMLPIQELSNLQVDIEKMYEHLTKTDLKMTMQIYEESFHKQGLICDRAHATEHRFQYLKSLYLERTHK